MQYVSITQGIEKIKEEEEEEKSQNTLIFTCTNYSTEKCTNEAQFIIYQKHKLIESHVMLKIISILRFKHLTN